MTIPILNGSTIPLERLLMHRKQAAAAATRWLAFMAQHNLSVCAFHVHKVPSNDEGGLSIGIRVDELEREGASVLSHSSVIVYEEGPGVFLQLVSLLVRAPAKAPSQ